VALIFCGFALSGPFLALVNWARGRPALAPAVGPGIEDGQVATTAPPDDPAEPASGPEHQHPIEPLDVGGVAESTPPREPADAPQT
jgi:hypothetical protein